MRENFCFLGLNQSKTFRWTWTYAVGNFTEECMSHMFVMKSRRWEYKMEVGQHRKWCFRDMSQEYVAAICPRDMLQGYVAGIYPSDMSQVYLQGCVPGNWPRDMSQGYVIGMCPRGVFLGYVPGICSRDMSNGLCPRATFLKQQVKSVWGVKWASVPWTLLSGSVTCPCNGLYCWTYDQTSLCWCSGKDGKKHLFPRHSSVYYQLPFVRCLFVCWVISCFVGRVSFQSFS